MNGTCKIGISSVKECILVLCATLLSTILLTSHLRYHIRVCSCSFLCLEMNTVIVVLLLNLFFRWPIPFFNTVCWFSTESCGRPVGISRHRHSVLPIRLPRRFVQLAITSLGSTSRVVYDKIYRGPSRHNMFVKYCSCGNDWRGTKAL